MLQVPNLAIESLGGFFASLGTWDFFLDGFVQYRSNMPWLSHFVLDRWSAVAITALWIKKMDVSI